MVSKKSSPSRVMGLVVLALTGVGVAWRGWSGAAAHPAPIEKSIINAANTERFPVEAPKPENNSANDIYSSIMPQAEQELTGMSALIQYAAETGCEFTPWPDGIYSNSAQDDHSKIDIYIDPTYWARGYIVVQRTQKVARSGWASTFGLFRSNQLVSADLYDSKHPESLLDLDSSNFQAVDIDGDIRGEFSPVNNGKFTTMVQYYNAYYPNEWDSRDMPSIRTINFSTGTVTDEFRASYERADLTPGTNRQVYRLSEGRNR